MVLLPALASLCLNVAKHALIQVVLYPRLQVSTTPVLLLQKKKKCGWYVQLVDDNFQGNDCEKHELKLILEKKYVVYTNDMNRLSLKGGKLKDAQSNLKAVFCRLHFQFTMDTEFNNGGCPKLTLEIPASIKLSTFEARVHEIIHPAEFADLLSSGQGRFVGVVDGVLHVLKKKGFKSSKAVEFMAENFAALSVVS